MPPKKPRPPIDPNCKECRGKGAYPPEEQKGLYIIIRVGRSKNAKPCKQCYR